MCVNRKRSSFQNVNSIGVPGLKLDCERALVGSAHFNESEMALFFECML
jgi:hypothetical protein